jgi:glutamate N-acetyltransferase/amino-acid N-acetyltransferase
VATSAEFPKGFRASGVAAGIKNSGAKDLALIVNDGPLKFGTAVFTTNKVFAAPVAWSRQAVADNEVSAVVLNSGGANACTGPEGFIDTHKTAEHVAEVLSVSASDVVVCSTGLIGVRLPMPQVIAGIDAAAKDLSEAGFDYAAQAIMTTDTHHKTSNCSRDGVSMWGMAKGAGMLAPALATMLSVIITDAIVDTKRAQEIFEEVVSRTFNRIDSDGCTSTNDTVLFMASGASGVEMSDDDLQSMLMDCANDLAGQLIADAEGHTKIVRITTEGAASEKDAEAVSRACARNNLLKCALHGEDPNWGRVLAAAGTADADMDGNLIDVTLNGVMVARSGGLGEDRSLVDLSGKEIDIVINLHKGNHSATVMTNDLTAMYVYENSAYSS